MALVCRISSTPKSRFGVGSVVLGFWLIVAFLLQFGLVGCSEEVGNSPKKVVIGLFGGMERNERGAVANALDLPELMKTTERDYALNLDTARVMKYPTDILKDLTDEGMTKKVWFDMRRIVGDEVVEGDSAYVEVSFLNTTTGTQYYNRFGVHRIAGRWRIYSFRLPVDSDQDGN